jgi:hypothetical protein
VSASTFDQVALAVRDLDAESAQILTATFDAMIAQTEEWAKQASLIKVTDIGQKREMKLARESRLALREIRINVENARKRLKEDSLRRGKAIDGVANAIKNRIEPIEAALLEQEQFADRHEAAQRAIEEAKAAEAQRIEQERLAAEQREADRVQRERADLERSERETAQRAENERLRREALERDAVVRAERERVEAERKVERAAADERLRIERVQRQEADERARKERMDRELAERTAETERQRRQNVEAHLLITQAPKPANIVDVDQVPPRPRIHLTVRSDRAFLGITASAIDRSIACSGWTAFPRVYRSSDHSDRGNAIHGYVRAVLSGTPQEAAILAVPEEHREICRQIDWGRLCGDLDQVQTEAAYALNVVTRTARFLGLNIGRHYASAAARTGEPLTENDVCGSLDVKGFRKTDGRPTIRDLKSGFVDVTTASKNGQVMFFAAVERLMTGAPEVDSEIAKLKPNGDIWFDRATFTPWEVDDYLDELEDTVEQHKMAKRVYLAGGVPDVTPNDGCHFCPAFEFCPAQTSLARAMLSEVDAMDRVGVDALTVEEAGEVMDRAYLRIRPVLNRILDAGKERAKREAIPLSGGKEYRPIEYQREDLSGDAVLMLARQLGATDEQVRECFRSSTVTQVRVLNANGASKSKRRAG